MGRATMKYITRMHFHSFRGFRLTHTPLRGLGFRGFGFRSGCVALPLMGEGGPSTGKFVRY